MLAYRQKSALIREALAHFVKRGAKTQWPQEAFDFSGIPEARPLEHARRGRLT